MATAELALAIPAVVLVLVVSLAAIAAGVDQVRCVDAARAAARSLARGDAVGVAQGLARGAGPPGASVSVGVSGELARATVSVPRSFPILGFSWVIRASAVAPREGAP